VMDTRTSRRARARTLGRACAAEKKRVKMEAMQEPEMKYHV